MSHGARPALAWVCASVAAGCAGADAAPTVPARHERWGIFRDLVLIARSEGKGGPYFLDRFEVSRRDLAQWLRTTGTAGPPGWGSLLMAGEETDPSWEWPAACVDLTSARAYASWRFCRLPTRDEWEHAASAGGAYRYPWGDPARAEWANTPELGLGQPAAIGTFESGRSPGGPYDLVGNVAEWTETLSGLALRDLAASLRFPSATVWLLPGQPVPTLALVAAAPRPLPRLVLGGAYLGLGDVGPRAARAREVPVLSCAPAEWSDTTGVRLAADPRSLLSALLREEQLPEAGPLELLRTFLAEPGHRAVLATELGAALERCARPGPLLAVLRAALRP